MSLKTYQKKRDFRRTSEPKGRKKSGKSGCGYVVQKHDASRLHYDFRLEIDGVLKSWAVPKGPSLNPKERRLAVEVEDHPVEYGSFEGIIPENEYGGGTVMLWDRGEWEADDDLAEGHKKGKLKFKLKGEKLSGGWTLVRMSGEASDGGKNWLLIKEKDKQARTGRQKEITDERPESVGTRRSLDEIAQAAKDNGRSSKRSGKSKQNSSRSSGTAYKKPSELPHARKAAMPRKLSPQLATLVDQVPTSDKWLHEIKFDGYRILCHLNDGKARLLTREGKDWTDRFKTVADAAGNIPVKQAIIDGEIVVLMPDGRSDFQALQNVLKGKSKGTLVYWVFDIPYCEGYDLTRTPLLARKKLLAGILQGEIDRKSAVIRFCDHIEGKGEDFHQHACRGGLEGIICKRADSRYEQKRSRNWVKVKCTKRQEFVIGGFTDPGGSRTGFGALLIGHYDNGDLVYAGKVGTGYNEQVLGDLSGRLKRIERKSPAFSNPPKGSEARGAHWVTPELVAEVAFSEWTADGMLRHPSFQGLREDKEAKSVKREAPQKTSGGSRAGTSTGKSKAGGQSNGEASVAGVRLSHPDRVLYPEQELTKRELAEFYERIADWVLPHVVNRPLSLVRCPKGREGDCFYQKHVTETFTDPVRGVTIPEKESKGKYPVIDNLAGLITLVQFGVLEIHPWGSREDKVERPDRIVFDLDPGENVPWEDVVEGARMVRGKLDDLGLESFVKTSGGKGLHVVVPIDRRSEWDEVKEFAKALAKQAAKDDPDRYVATMSKEKRRGKVFIDYLRNSRGATSVAAYSTRAKAGATVSTPIRWDELSDGTDPAGYSVQNLPDRLTSLDSDPWKGFFECRQSITAAMKKQLGI